MKVVYEPESDDLDTAERARIYGVIALANPDGTPQAPSCGYLYLRCGGGSIGECRLWWRNHALWSCYQSCEVLIRYPGGPLDPAPVIPRARPMSEAPRNPDPDATRSFGYFCQEYAQNSAANLLDTPCALPPEVAAAKDYYSDTAPAGTPTDGRPASCGARDAGTGAALGAPTGADASASSPRQTGGTGGSSPTGGGGTGPPEPRPSSPGCRCSAHESRSLHSAGLTLATVAFVGGALRQRRKRRR